MQTHTLEMWKGKKLSEGTEIYDDPAVCSALYKIQQRIWEKTKNEYIFMYVEGGWVSKNIPSLFFFPGLHPIEQTDRKTKVNSDIQLILKHAKNVIMENSHNQPSSSFLERTPKVSWRAKARVSGEISQS